MKKSDAIVVGAGFYGCCIALHLSQYYDHVVLLEKENDIVKKASSINQARVHGGYHYPRSLLTAASSLRNYTRFIADFKNAIVDDIEHIYAVTKHGSKTNVNQFYYFFKKLGAPLSAMPDALKNNLFDPTLIDNAFIVTEAIYNWVVLRDILLQRLAESGVTVLFNQDIQRIEKCDGHLLAFNQHDDVFSAKKIFGCLYADLNALRTKSGLTPLPLKYQLAELPLIEAPPLLSHRAITIMDGSFFTMLPYPEKNRHTLGHVRYTNHLSWTEPHLVEEMRASRKESRFMYMKKDAMRFMPILADIENTESLYEIRTVLQQNEHDDGRPILFHEDSSLPYFYTVMGSKIDNMYDVLEFISNDHGGKK